MTEISKLSKTELIKKCEELGINKCKSKNKTEILTLITNKLNNNITVVPVESVELFEPVETNKQTAYTENNKIYEKNNIKLIHGNCFEKLELVDDKSVQLICIDPPYNIGKDDWDNINDYGNFMINIISLFNGYRFIIWNLF